MNSLQIPPQIRVHSLYWANISRAILSGQRTVYRTLGIPLVQHLNDQKQHGIWMTEILADAGADDVIVFSDIDAFPLSSAAYRRAVDYASRGGVFGLAQFSGHTETTDLYAGPMFLALRKSIWENMGSPELSDSPSLDAGEIISIRARELGIPVMLVNPCCCINPKWALAHAGVFGIGTFYGELEFFHLFQARADRSIELFSKVADDVIEGRTLNFAAYLQLMNEEQLCERLSRRIHSVMKALSRQTRHYLYDQGRTD